MAYSSPNQPMNPIKMQPPGGMNPFPGQQQQQQGIMQQQPMTNGFPQHQQNGMSQPQNRPMGGVSSIG